MPQDNRTARRGAPQLALGELAKGTMPGLTAIYGACLAEAASVCLDEQRHDTGVEMGVDGDHEARFALSWEQVSDQARRCWADRDFTTEQGAYGIAALLVPRMTDLTVLKRSPRGNGFDFWLAGGGHLFQGCTRLEVSGIRSGDQAAIGRRVQEKLSRLRRHQSALPALVAVVEFGQPRSRVVRK